MGRRNLLVTGASAGIGAATARLAGRRGYNVAIHYNSDRAGAERVAGDVEAAGGQAVLIQGNVAQPEAVSRIFAEFDAALPGLDAFVNNAGIVDMKTRVDEISADRLINMVNINLVGAFLAAKEAVLRMSTAHGGTGGAIVNLSSAAAKLGAAGQYVDYAATKGAIEVLNLGLSQEVANEGVRVNAIRPGIIETDIHAKGGLPNRAAEMAPMVPMKRSGSAEEVAEAILWLLSDASSYVTGTVMDVTGGR
ncbi:MAG: SDR family oxidoreductase [Pseudomonadota bacterium]